VKPSAHVPTESLAADGVCQQDIKIPALNIGLFGFGCVGQGLYDVMNHSQCLKAEIGNICVKDPAKPRSLDSRCFTFDKEDILQNRKHNLVVELIDDADAALEIITRSLKRGSDVVSANKKVIAENFELLYNMQQQYGASLLYEAACAGSIPIIRTLEEYYDNELLSSVKGILNGSSNYILSKMEFDRITYGEALKQAQEKGFAETDPALDVNGTDAKYKLCLLAAHGFGLILKPNDLLNLGVQNVTPFDINYAAQNNSRIKLVAGIEKTTGTAGGFYRAYVLPRFVSRESPLATINYEFNGIEVEGVYSDKQFFVGKGAGSHPTGSAVLSDISAITYNYRYGYKKLKKRTLSPCRRGSLTQNGGKILHSADPFQMVSSKALDLTPVHSPNGMGFKSPLKRGGTAVSGDGVCENTTGFSGDHRFIDNDFTIRLYIRYSDKADLDLLDISTIHEQYTSPRGNYIIAHAGFRSLFNLSGCESELFVCEVEDGISRKHILA
jgi:homoserine dehydrogenase